MFTQLHSSSLLLLITVLISVGISASPHMIIDGERYKECSRRFECGSVKNITYPFWGEGRNKDCGLPEFKLECRDDYPVMEIMSEDYRVLSIDQKSCTMNVVRMDFLDDACPDKFVNITIDQALFHYAPKPSARYLDLSLFYNCPSPISSNHFTCTGNGIAVGDCYYATTPTWKNQTQSCKGHIVVPILQKSLEKLQHGSERLYEVLRSGFDLKYKYDVLQYCSRCLHSGGQCGSNSSSNEFACFRPERPTAIRNVTFESDWFAYGPNVSNLFFLSNCSLPLPENLTRNEHDCAAGNGTGWGMAMLGKDRKFSYAVERCNKRVAAPVEVYGDDERNGNEDYVGMLRRGFVLKWKSNYCGGCEASGGLCGFNVTEYRSKCYCPDRPHAERCNPTIFINRKKKLGLILGTGASATGLLIAIVLFCFFRRKYSSRKSMIFGKTKNGNHLDVEGFLKNCRYLGTNRYNYSDVKKMTNSFKEKLGQGGYGGVYKGKLHNGRLAAVKVLSESKEMVGGRKNIDVGVDHTSEIYFPHWIYKRLELNDEIEQHDIRNEKDNENARKMTIVGLWCIQTDPSNRPAMSSVVDMLKGSLESLQIPPKPFLSSPPRPPPDSSTT
ncbi:hypothetical protein F0562_034085 [Nyssa sinensis]|uniref:non-specific serine/threonine protein kinase n=1 Tax=Nyssa sinensis TaxID=561372 RepID=A0A5J5AH97_9ASTE|nr:hypothetical protein F0562_034085 [Nyssa sinensis]